MGLLRHSKKRRIIHFILPILILVLITCYFINSYQNSFDETMFSVDNAHEYIRELASPKYSGRLTGTEKNELALKYIEDHFKSLGIEAAGENNTYYQHFKSMVPQIDSQPVFRIENENGEMLDEFKMYEDYSLLTSEIGGASKFNGDILFVDKYLYKVSPELIKDKVVVMRSYAIRPKDIDYVIENHGKGLFFSKITSFDSEITDPHRKKEILYKDKKGQNILFGNLGKEAYGKLRKYSEYRWIEEEYQKNSLGTTDSVPKGTGIIKGVEINIDLEFPIVKSANIFGKIDGKKQDGGYLIIGAHLDHVGGGADSKYFPGALDNASGVGMMLELARVIKAQDNLPYKTIIFVGWNAQENGLDGSKYYVDNPIYPLQESQVINLDCIGSVNANKVRIESYESKGHILRSKMYQYSEDLNIKAEEVYRRPDSDHYWFVKENIPAIQLVDDYSYVHTYDDTIDNISKENLGNVGKILVNYIKRDIFKDTFPDYLNNIELMLLSLLIFGIIFIYIIFSLNKINPGMKIVNTTIEDIYYSSIFNIVLKCYYFVTPVLIILFALIFIANLPPNYNLVFYNGKSFTNLSMYLTLKKSILYIRNLILSGLGTTNNHVAILEIILVSMARSFKLILTTIIISFVFGIFKGMFDSYRGGSKKNLRTVGTLMALSLPDVLIVLCGLLLIMYIGKNDMLKTFIDTKTLRGFVMPLLTLAIIPTVYVSRITFIIIQEEVRKGYISAAKGRGLSKLAIYIKHIFSSVVFKVIDSIPTLMTIIISNLIIVEYLFNYKGVVFNLYRFYVQNDVTSFIGLSLALGLLYVIFILIAKLITKLLNPMKGAGAR